MKRVVVSAISLVWMIFSTSSLVLILASLFTSGWLRRVESGSSFWEANCQTVSPSRLHLADQHQYMSPSLGPFFRCETPCPGHTPTRSLPWLMHYQARIYCRLSLWGGGQNPASSNAALWIGTFLMLGGLVTLLFAHTLMCTSVCKRELCGRSIFQLTGLSQCAADLLLLSGLFVWPAGWGSIPVQEVCGASTAAYQKGNCEWS
uniref:LHFPL tetraspan subfamily member 4b n=1 Tax=Mesocestoides corti TaxID=53468 RepID=A0A5K3F132_MESCO